MSLYYEALVHNLPAQLICGAIYTAYMKLRKHGKFRGISLWLTKKVMLLYSYAANNMQRYHSKSGPNSTVH